MSAAPPLQLAPEERLDILKYLDEFHFWNSLDDERRCQRCGKSITGRQILIVELQGTRRKMRLQCPTAGCISNPSEWVYANPVLTAKLRMDFHPRAQKLNGICEPAPRTRDQARPVQRAKRAMQKNDGATGRTSLASSVCGKGLKDVLGRLALLRPLATGLRAIHPLF